MLDMQLDLKTHIPNAQFRGDGQFSKFASLTEENHFKKLGIDGEISSGWVSVNTPTATLVDGLKQM